MEIKTATLALFCVVWTFAAAVDVNIPQDLYEFARGDNIVLPCIVKSALTNPTLVVITWSAGDAVILTHYSTPGLTDVSSEYDGRATLDVNLVTGKADLKLSSIVLKDNNNYECRAQIPKDITGKPSDIAQLIVLVAPTTPVCNIQGRAEYGQNINLTCVSEEGSPAPTYKWESRDTQNNPRPFDPKTTDKGGILSLYNVTKDTSGYFICTSTNKIGSATCNVTLAVMPPSMNIGSTAGIIGGVAAALVLLVIIICCCCCRKKKQEKNEEYAMGAKEEEYRDKEPLENGNEQERTQERTEQRDNYEERNERPKDYDDHHGDYDDRRSDYTDRDRRDYDDRRSDYNDRDRRDYDDRRSDYNDRDRRDYDDRRSDYNDRRSDYDDRRSDYNDRRSDYDDRRSDYSERRSDYDDRRNKYGDRRERYDDDRRYDDERRRNDRRDREKP